jgi:hypothetical protein
MRYTLLKMVQLILSAMDSDEVNSISDTTESLQVVDQIETTYNHLAATLDFPDNWDFFELEPTSDVSKPTLMRLPENVAKVEWLQYDVSEPGSTVRKTKDLLPMDRKVFFDRMNSLDSSHSNVYSYDLLVDSATFDVRGYNDRSPTYYTSNDDHTLIFDNYDASVGQTLQGNRTKGFGMIIPVFIRDDDFIPPLEPRQFTLFFNEAKAACFADLKQVTNAKAEQRARRGWVQAHRKDPQIDLVDNYRATAPNFGRNRRGRR